MKKIMLPFGILLCLQNLSIGQNVGIGTSFPTARLHVSGAIKLEGTNLFEFGANVPGKEVNAGKIGYNAFGQNALTFIGAGTNNTDRSFYFYGEGGTTFNGPATIFGNLNIGGRLLFNSNAGLNGQVLQSTGSLTSPVWISPTKFQYNNTFIDYLALNKTALSTGEGIGIFSREITLTGNAIVTITPSATINGNPAIGRMASNIRPSGSITGGYYSSAYFQSNNVGFGSVSDNLVVSLPAGLYTIEVSFNAQSGSSNISVFGISSASGNTFLGARMKTEIIYQ